MASSPDNPLMPEISKMLPIMARLLDGQLRRIEHSPCRRRRPSATMMLQQMRIVGAIIKNLEFLNDIEDALAAAKEGEDTPEEEAALRESFAREIERVAAQMAAEEAEQRARDDKR